MPAIGRLKDVIGKRGEIIAHLCLTDYSRFRRPLFAPGFLGDKWPGIDFYVELAPFRGKTFYFLAQIKSTKGKLTNRAIRVNTAKCKVAALKKIPGPTYIFAIHEPTKRVFLKAVHARTPARAVSAVSLSNELTAGRLKDLYDEIASHWIRHFKKPVVSCFP